MGAGVPLDLRATSLVKVVALGIAVMAAVAVIRRKITRWGRMVRRVVMNTSEVYKNSIAQRGLAPDRLRATEPETPGLPLLLVRLRHRQPDRQRNGAWVMCPGGELVSGEVLLCRSLLVDGLYPAEWGQQLGSGVGPPDVRRNTFQLQ
jgi:hypothetical protein